MRSQGKKLARLARLLAEGEIFSDEDADDVSASNANGFDAALAAFGLARESPDGVDAPKVDTVYLWPCNERTYVLWCHIQTQWRHDAMGVRTGLDYAAVLAYARHVARIREVEIPGHFKGLRAMERAALDVWAQKKK